MQIILVLITLLTLVVTIVAGRPALAQSGVHVVVNFTEVRSNGTGEVGDVARTVEAMLLGGNHIIDVDRRHRVRGSHGLGRGRGRHGGRGAKEQTSGSVFRGDFRPVEKGHATGNWRVGANNALVRTVSYRSDQETIVVSLSGAHSCVARVTFRLKPGQDAFLRRHGTRRFTNVHARDVSCTISG